MDSCKICANDFENSPDQLVLCEHHKGFTHHGCCTNRCSLDNKPCIHAKSIYAKNKK